MLLIIAAVLRLAGVGAFPADLGGMGLWAALATAGVAALLVLAATLPALRREPRSALARLRTTLRERTLRTAFLPQRDPDAAGRPRPRAPGAGIAAA
ncbi:hypothetical protein GCM10009678_30880 [Actinomadura kijaniata]|uniref:Uncharacterized protein n=1 Tax=Actinomadura namibiensis TaxID=182080 RepID=A0A7W3LPS5_ACTNM|nr:DUF6412 domain-containing protein [Actinomadura namibiensis]MBA8951945.1 hypothetical protein [Actinomadura namibiensis]